MPDPQPPEIASYEPPEIVGYEPPAGAAKASPQKQDDSTLGAVGRGLSSFWEQINPITAVQSTGQAILHPIDTAKALGQAQGEQYTKAAKSFQEGDYVTGARHAINYLLPIIGPALDVQSEKGAKGDIAGMVGGSLGLGTAIAAPELAKRVGVPTLPKVADRIEQSAESKFVTAISPKTGPQKARFASMAAKAAPEALRDPELGAYSRQGLTQIVAGKLEQAEAALDEASAARNANRGYDTAAIIKDLEAQKAAITAQPLEGSRLIPSVESPAPKRGLSSLSKPSPEQVPVARPLGQPTVPSPSAARIAALDQVIAEVKQLGPMASYEALRRIRQSWDTLAKTKYAPVAADPFQSAKFQASANGAADATQVLREHLSQFDPKTAAANSRYSLYRSLNDVLQATEEAERVRPSRGRAIAARLATSIVGEQAAGPAGALTGWLAGSMIDEAMNTGVTTRLATARAMTDLADALRAGNAPKVKSILYRIASMTRTTAGLKTALAGGTMVPATAETEPTTTP